ncbi:uncharacterized protein LOC131060709 [Cryptomeria japonica]|uniref:uncharacterized protein LOC131060709 n=1 Tax=Cryptomeria japonica TaxID=3369 RepID=UPI0027DA8525|nr:uncharacterized protein LOC131060709 [Cryptomeria japonica]
MVLMRTRMGLSTIYCGPKKKKVQVIQPDGKHRHVCPPMTARALLLQYSQQYCVRHVSGSILAMDDELEGGNTYLLSPLPRLFPSSPGDGNSANLKRAKSWKPSLQVIAENNAPVRRSVDKQNKDFVKPAPGKPQYRVHQNTWHLESPICMPYVGPTGFMF